MSPKELAMAFFKAVDADDAATVQKLFGPKHQFYTTMSPQPMNSEQHVGFMKAFNGAFDGGRHEITDMIEAGNKVVVRGVWHGTHTAEFNGIPATNKTVHLSFIIIFEMENDEIRNQWIEMDGMSFMMQLGVVPAQEHA